MVQTDKAVSLQTYISPAAANKTTEMDRWREKDQEEREGGKKQDRERGKRCGK